MKYDTIVMACKFNAWCVKPFLVLCNKYWPENNVTIVSEEDYSGGEKCQFLKLPSEFIVNGECPRGIFSNSLIWALNNTSNKLAIVLLADYWMYGAVNAADLDLCADYMLTQNDVLRTDVGDRNNTNSPYNKVNDLLAECAEARDCFFPLSLTPGMWDKRNWLQLLEVGWDPWQSEQLSHRKYMTIHTHMRSLLCNPGPIKYSNTMRGRDDSVVIVRRESIDDVRQFIPPRFSLGFEN